MSHKSIELKLNVRIWIDLKTHLPLKREWIPLGARGFAPTTNTYEIQLNPKLDAEKFKLPKDD